MIQHTLALEQGCIALTDQGVARLDASGGTVWRAEADPGDPIVEIRLAGEEVRANTWNGFQLHICLRTGQILDRRPVK